MSGIQFQTVLFHNRPEALKRSARSLCASLEYACGHGQNLDRCVLLWGDASEKPCMTEAELEKLRSECTGLDIEYVLFGENTGTSRGHNRLLPMAGCDLLVTMNPDVVAAPSCVFHLLEAFAEEKTGMAEARQTPLEHPKAYDPATRTISWASGAFSMIRRACFEEIGGYDEHFFLYCDDVDLSWRARLKGWNLVYVPEAVVYHGKGLSGDGGMQPTDADLRYSPEAEMMLMYRYGWTAELEEKKRQLAQSPLPLEREALAAFEERERCGGLPDPLDPEHKVSHFPLYAGDMSRFRPEDGWNADVVMTEMKHLWT